MVGIVMMLAAIVGSMILGVGDVLHEPAPQGHFEQEYVASGEGNTDYRPYVEVTHEFGKSVPADRIVIKDESGNTVEWGDVWTAGPTVAPGEYVHLDGFGSDGALDPICEEGDKYWIIFQDEDGDALMVNKWEAPSDPNLPPDAQADGFDDDGDGIPNWC